MIYWLAGIYCGAFLAWVAVVEVSRWRKRRRVPREALESPTMTEARCAQLGHVWITKTRDHPWRSCPRCKAFERVDMKDFDVRR